MHEFETFVYLDVEKTGSTFISRMLNQFAREDCECQSHHRPLGSNFEPHKFYFASVRDPLDSYLSLYSFGCQQSGKVYGHLRNRGLDDLYDGTLDGFSEWLRFLLRKKNAEALGDRYHRIAEGRICRLVGFQSYRYLRLAIPDPETLLEDCRSEDDIRRVYEAHKLPRYLVRHESFVEDLCALVSGPLAHAFPEQDAVLDYIRSTEPANASERVDAGGGFEISEKLKRKLGRREWLSAEVLGYGVQGGAEDDDES